MGVEDLRFELGAILTPAPVPLAHRQPVIVGPLTIEPALRRMSDGTGRSRKIEPLVMQVLLALVSADGATLSRDDLITACWEGRIVSDDAVNRVMSRLRRIFADLAGEAVMLETVAKVGYRLVVDEPVVLLAVLPAFPARAIPGPARCRTAPALGSGVGWHYACRYNNNRGRVGVFREVGHQFRSDYWC